MLEEITQGDKASDVTLKFEKKSRLSHQPSEEQEGAAEEEKEDDQTDMEFSSLREATQSPPIVVQPQEDEIPEERDPEIARILSDSVLDDMTVSRACTALACRLSEALIGLEVLKVSNLTGRHGMQALDGPKLKIIEQLIFKKYGHRLSARDFRTLWKKCRDAIGNKCRNLRHTRYVLPPDI